MPSARDMAQRVKVIVHDNMSSTIVQETLDPKLY